MLQSPNAPRQSPDIYAIATAYERGEKIGAAVLVEEHGDEERRERRAKLREAFADLKTYEMLRAF